MRSPKNHPCFSFFNDAAIIILPELPSVVQYRRVDSAGRNAERFNTLEGWHSFFSFFGNAGQANDLSVASGGMADLDPRADKFFFGGRRQAMAGVRHVNVGFMLSKVGGEL